MAAAVLDASALLAYLGDEPGAEAVADAIAGGASISTVSLSELLGEIAARGGDPARVARQMTERGLLGGAVAVEPFTSADVIEAARLRPLTHEHGLPLAARACLALGRRLGAPVLTADERWSRLDVPVELRPIR